MFLFKWSDGNAPPPSPFRDVSPRDIGNNLSVVLDTRKSNLVSQQWAQRAIDLYAIYCKYNFVSAELATQQNVRTNLLSLKDLAEIRPANYKV